MLPTAIVTDNSAAGAREHESRPIDANHGGARVRSSLYSGVVLRADLGHDFFPRPHRHIGLGASTRAGVLASTRRRVGVSDFLFVALATTTNNPHQFQTCLRHCIVRHGDTRHIVFLRRAESAGRCARDHRGVGADANLRDFVVARHRAIRATTSVRNYSGIGRRHFAGRARHQFARAGNDALVNPAANRLGFLHAGKYLCGYASRTTSRHDRIANHRIDARGTGVSADYLFRGRVLSDQLAIGSHRNRAHCDDVGQQCRICIVFVCGQTGGRGIRQHGRLCHHPVRRVLGNDVLR